MAEKETKEKATINMNIWFILFLIYLIFSLAYGFSLINENKALKAEIANKDNTIADMENLNKYTTDELAAIIDDISNKLAEAKNVLNERKNEANNSSNLSTGVYTSTPIVSGDENSSSMTLTLSETNEATLALTNESGDSTLTGTYSIVDNTVVFTSNDGITTYSFTINEDGSLKLVDGELTLSK